MDIPLKRAGPAWIDDAFSGLDACGQAELVRRKELAPLELVDAAIARIERLNPTLNALASQEFERARERARGSAPTGIFAGVPTLLKDLLAYPGMKTEFGARAFAGQVAQEGSDYTAALDASGLIILGKSATSELGLLGTTETLLRGATRNPWNPACSTGGSSGGAVAAVASGMVPVAHASDGGGSIRGPAALCGLFGFKPSRGRHRSIGPAGATPFGTILSDHCVSRSVRDSAAWLAVTERSDPAAPLPPVGLVVGPASRRLRIGVHARDGFGNAPDPELAHALEQTATLCERRGHIVTWCDGPRFDAPATSDAFFSLAGAGIAGLFSQLRQFNEHFPLDAFEPFTRELAERFGKHPAESSRRALAVFEAAARDANRFFGDHEVALCPTVPFTAFPLKTIGPESRCDEVIAFTQRLAGYTAIASIAGWCAMSVPLHVSSEGMPIGMHFSAPAGREASLLELAYELERAQPWQQRKPKLNGVNQ